MGILEKIFGAKKIVTNSLHGQGIKRAGERIIIEGHATDGTPEAIRIKDALNFAYAVQWHPEWNALKDSISKPFSKHLARQFIQQIIILEKVNSLKCYSYIC